MNFSFPYNIVPCRREAWPRLRPLIDLTRNVTVARKLTEELWRFFQFKPELLYFSGYAQPSEDPEAIFYVQLWEGGELYRSVGFKDLGYVGILHVEPNESSILYEAILTDWVSAAYHGFNDMRYITDGFQRETLCLVRGDYLTVHLPWKP